MVVKLKTEEDLVQRKEVMGKIKEAFHYLATGVIYGTFSHKELCKGLQVTVLDGDLETQKFIIKKVK